MVVAFSAAKANVEAMEACWAEVAEVKVVGAMEAAMEGKSEVSQRSGVSSPMAWMLLAAAAAARAAAAAAKVVVAGAVETCWAGVAKAVAKGAEAKEAREAKVARAMEAAKAVEAWPEPFGQSTVAEHS